MNMLRTAAFLLLAPLAAILPNAATGQALPTASKSGSIQAGAGAEYFNNDYTARKNAGLLIYGDYDFLHLFHTEIGLEAEIRRGGIYSPDDIGENTYLIGPRLSYRRRNLRIYAKALAGRGTIFYDVPNGGSSSYNVFAAGAGVEYRVSRHFNIRAIDAEAQKWPDFPPNGLTPIALSAGVAYIIR